MSKLKILWKNRNTWVYAFDEWYVLMYPHIYYSTKWIYDKIDEQDNAYWFFEALNNYDNVFDEWGL